MHCAFKENWIFSIYNVVLLFTAAAAAAARAQRQVLRHHVKLNAVTLIIIILHFFAAVVVIFAVQIIHTFLIAKLREVCRSRAAWIKTSGRSMHFLLRLNGSLFVVFVGIENDKGVADYTNIRTSTYNFIIIIWEMHRLLLLLLFAVDRLLLPLWNMLAMGSPRQLKYNINNIAFRFAIAFLKVALCTNHWRARLHNILRHPAH